HDAVSDAIDRAQRSVRILEDHRHPGRVVEPGLAGSDLGPLPAPIQDLAAGRLVHAREHARDRALAASTLADPSDALVGADDEVDVVDRVQAPAGELAADVKVAREPDGADDRL